MSRRFYGYDDSYSNNKPTSLVKEETESSPRNGIVDGSAYVILRKGPNKTAGTARILKQGTKLRILGEESGFYKVIPENFKSVDDVMYIDSNFCKVVE